MCIFSLTTINKYKVKLAVTQSINHGSCKQEVSSCCILAQAHLLWLLMNRYPTCYCDNRTNVSDHVLYLLDALHSRAGLRLVSHDDGAELDRLVPCLVVVHVLVRLGELRLSGDSVPPPWGPAGPLLRQPV